MNLIDTLTSHFSKEEHLKNVCFYPSGENIVFVLNNLKIEIMPRQYDSFIRANISRYGSPTKNYNLILNQLYAPYISVVQNNIDRVIQLLAQEFHQFELGKITPMSSDVFSNQSLLYCEYGAYSCGYKQLYFANDKAVEIVLDNKRFTVGWGVDVSESGFDFYTQMDFPIAYFDKIQVYIPAQREITSEELEVIKKNFHQQVYEFFLKSLKIYEKHLKLGFSTLSNSLSLDDLFAYKHLVDMYMLDRTFK